MYLFWACHIDILKVGNSLANKLGFYAWQINKCPHKLLFELPFCSPAVSVWWLGCMKYSFPPHPACRKLSSLRNFLQHGQLPTVSIFFPSLLVAACQNCHSWCSCCCQIMAPDSIPAILVTFPRLLWGESYPDSQIPLSQRARFWFWGLEWKGRRGSPRPSSALATSYLCLSAWEPRAD